MSDREHYQKLGIPAGASPAEVRAAYRRLVRRYHPDLNPDDLGALERIKEVNAAYEALCDPAIQAPDEPDQRRAPEPIRRQPRSQPRRESGWTIRDYPPPDFATGPGPQRPRGWGPDSHFDRRWRVASDEAAALIAAMEALLARVDALDAELEEEAEAIFRRLQFRRW